MTRFENRQESVTGSTAVIPARNQELTGLREFSAHLGLDPLLVQASSGNTSIKTNGVLWVKASGKWLQDAEREEMFVPLDLAMVLDSLERNASLPTNCPGTSGSSLIPSIETFLHAVVPAKVVVHVHSVNTIAWAVRRDAPSQLRQRLLGMRWCLIPYASSGIPLAREIGKVLARDPRTNVFVLANHGLVICGESCDAVQMLLCEVEQRLKLAPRETPPVQREFLAGITSTTQWKLPDCEALHALGCDPVSLRIVREGVLYPCQALFLGRHAPIVPHFVSAAETEGWADKKFGVQPFVILEGSGVLVSANITGAEIAMLRGLSEVTRRLDLAVPIRYLSPDDVDAVLGAEGLRYKDSAQRSRL